MNKIQPGRKTRFKMPMRYLIEPETWGRTPRFQQLLEMYRWMAQTADVPRYQGKSGWRGGYPGCQQLLNGGESSIGPILIRPFTGDWAKDLQQRFLHVLLSRHASPPVTLWRKDFDIQIDAVKWVQTPWFECWPREQHLPWLTYHERNWQYEGELLKRILSIREDGPESESLVWQLNTEHAGAVAVHGVRLNLVHDYRKPGPYPLIWSFDVLIGYPKDRNPGGTIHWHSRVMESFLSISWLEPGYGFVHFRVNRMRRSWSHKMAWNWSNMTETLSMHWNGAFATTSESERTQTPMGTIPLQPF